MQWRTNEFESWGGGHWSRAKVGGTDPAQSRKNFFGRAPPLFGPKTQVYNSRFRERFRDG